MRGELGSAFGVAADELHEGAGIDRCGSRVGAAVGEFDVEHFDEGLDFVRADALFDLGAFAVNLGDAQLLAVETDFSGSQEIQDGFGWGAVTVL